MFSLPHAGRSRLAVSATALVSLVLLGALGGGLPGIELPIAQTHV